MAIPGAAKITIENRTVEIARVLDLIERFADRHRIAAGVATSVAVCIDELLSNTIRYGYPKRRQGRISIALSVDADRLCARIEDDGRPFDPSPEVEARAPLPTPAIGGYGLVLVHALVDEFSYSSGGSLNVTMLKKRFDSRPAPEAAASGHDASGDK